MARLRSAPSAQQTAQATQTTRQALREKTNTARTKAPVYENDGNTDGLVKDARPRRGQARKVAQREGDFVMAGALGLADSSDRIAEQTQPPPPRKGATTTTSSSTTTTTTTTSTKTMRKPVTTEESISSAGSLPTKPPTARRSRASAIPERSHFSLPPSPPPAGKLGSVNRHRSSLAQPGSALRAQATPGVETSILALKNFKRRPRQPSMLQMVQQRTASARPSAANAQVNDDVDVFDLEDVEVEEEEEFAPEAEGTPVRVKKGSKQAARQAKNAVQKKQKVESGLPVKPSVASSKKRKSDDVDLSSTALDALRAKRHKPNASEVDTQVSGDQEDHFGYHDLPEQHSSPPPPIEPEVQVIHSSPSSSLPSEPPSPERQRSPDLGIAVPSTEQEQHEAQHIPLNDTQHEIEDHGIPNGTMAEPVSSSPLPADPLATQRTDIMADPLTQISPPRPKRDRATKKTKAKPMTTATLQSLLPKRRQPLKTRHRKSEYDVDSDSEDEIFAPGYESSRRGRRRTRRKTETAD